MSQVTEYYRSRYQSHQQPQVKDPQQDPQDPSYETDLEDPFASQEPQGVEGGEDPLEGGDQDAPAKTDVTREEILALLKDVQDGAKKPEEEILSKDEAIKILEQALKTEDLQDDATAYSKVLDAVGGEEDPEDKDIKKYGAKPAKVENGTIYFNGTQDGGNLSLKAPGEGAPIEVDKVTSVSLTPHDPKDKVKISKSGKDLIVKMGNDTFKIKNGAEDVKVQINSDNVEGKVPTDLDISVGASSKTSKKYFDPKKIKEATAQLRDGANQISAIQYAPAFEDMDIPPDSIGRSLDFMFGMNKVYALKPTTKYAVGWHGEKMGTLDQFTVTDAANEAAKEVEDTKKGKDPKKLEKLGEELTEMVGNLKTQTADPRNANNRGQLIYDVLVGQLGKDGAKELLKAGIIPETFAKGVADLLEAVPEENTNMKDEIDGWIYGNNGDTHGTAAAFLKNNAKAADTGDGPSEDPTTE